MTDKIKRLAKELNAVILFGELDGPGHVSFPDYLKGKAIVFVNSRLNSQQQKTVVLHELGHIAKQRDEKCLYNQTMAMKMKMEYGANRFMIKYLFNSYIDYTGDEPRSVNYLEFMRQNDIPSRDENIVKEVIANY